MSRPDDAISGTDDEPAPPTGDGTDVTVGPQDLQGDAEATPTSTAEGYREDGDTQGGTGGLDAGGAG
jgi:hypothetical protein